MIARYTHKLFTRKGDLKVEEVATIAEKKKAEVISITIVGLSAWVYLQVQDQKHMDQILVSIEEMHIQRQAAVASGVKSRDPRGPHIVRYSSITGSPFTEMDIATIAQEKGAATVSMAIVGTSAWTFLRVKDAEHYAEIRAEISRERSRVEAKS